MLPGKKTTLRLLERADLPIVAEWRNDPEMRPHFFTPYLITMSAQDRWYDTYLNRGDSIVFIIQLGDTRQSIGMAGLDHIDHRNQTAEYGRMLIADRRLRGHGYAHDATLTLLHYAFTDLNLNRIYLRTYADNANALAFYERCGFLREGTEREALYMGGAFRDLALMSVLRKELIFSKGRLSP